MDDGVQKLFEHLFGRSESGGILYDKSQKKDKPAANSDGCEDPDVEHRVFIGGWELEVLSNERHVSVR